MQRTPDFAPRNCGVGVRRPSSRTVNIAHDDRVNLRIKPLDARPEMVKRLAAAYLLCLYVSG
jgi:hypothetical protein